MITTRVLVNNNEIEDASALLHDIYIEHMKWKFLPDNPSRLRVEVKNNRKLLIDRFTNIATWFGAFDGEQLVGCIRLCGLDENNKFEVEGYPSSQVIHQYLPRENCLEMGKMVVKVEYQGQKILHSLYLVSLEFCKQKHYSVFGCAHNPFVKSLFHKIKLLPQIEQAFKYELDDPLVNFYFLHHTSSKFNTIINNLKKLQDNIQDNLKLKRCNILEALEIIAPVLPTAIYWHDINGVVLGLNEHCLKGIGTTRDSIIGKTPYDFYPHAVAEHILKHNQLVINTGEILSQEESINNLITGELVFVTAVKAPLFDDDGNIIGILGTSIDITAEKEATRLKLENLQLENEKQVYQAEQKTQQLFKKFIGEIQNTIQSHKMLFLNDKLGLDSNGIQQNQDIVLTKRENEVLYYLSLNRSPKEIADILSKIEGKRVASATIQAIIDKQLYLKFGVHSISKLIEKANILKLIPFLPIATI
jgi:PAS domain S-box-containing protein